jgi:DNA-binding phage protein
MNSATELADVPTTAPSPPGRWEQIRERLLDDPEARERYERTFQVTVEIRRLLQTIEAEREQAGLTKAELARLAGTNPAAMRRLLTAETSNPTLRTLLAIFDALGLELSLRPKRPAPKG